MFVLIHDGRKRRLASEWLQFTRVVFGSEMSIDIEMRHLMDCDNVTDRDGVRGFTKPVTDVD